MKKVVTIILAIMVVFSILSITVPAHEDPIKTEFENEKNQIEFIKSSDNQKLKKDLIEFIEMHKSTMYENAFKIEDSFLRVSNGEIQLITLEKVDGKRNIKTYELFFPSYFEDAETKLAKEIESGKFVFNNQYHYMFTDDYIIRLHP